MITHFFFSVPSRYNISNTSHDLHSEMLLKRSAPGQEQLGAAEGLQAVWSWEEEPTCCPCHHQVTTQVCWGPGDGARRRDTGQTRPWNWLKDVNGYREWLFCSYCFCKCLGNQYKKVKKNFSFNVYWIVLFYFCEKIDFWNSFWIEQLHRSTKKNMLVDKHIFQE